MSRCFFFGNIGSVVSGCVASERKNVGAKGDPTPSYSNVYVGGRTSIDRDRPGPSGISHRTYRKTHAGLRSITELYVRGLNARHR